MEKLLKITALLFFMFWFIIPQSALAQISSIGIANYLPIADSKVEDGDIIVSSDKGYSVSRKAYDPKLVGVASLNPAISIRTTGEKKGIPVIGSGTAFVKVSGSGGNINKGDFITSSDTPGTGMKAIKSGMVIGTSLENMRFSKKTDINILQIAVNPHQIQTGAQSANSIFDLFKLSKEVTTQQPSKALQYLVAGIITIATFGCGFLIFARTVNTGLEALGRNPLAGRMIQFSILFNIIMIIIILVLGTGLAYVVIRL
jgi:F0F1-type ATP synthase membrane subunit c/vacuolar-type H+-ATPase subunit K